MIKIENLYKEYPSGEDKIQVLKNINLEIKSGEIIAIIGASGSGKSTLMNILGCLDKPTMGSYKLNGIQVGSLDTEELAKLRREYFGFIFQRYHLLSSSDALGNVEVPAIYAGKDSSERKVRAREILTKLGLGDKIGNYPSQLSGGQQQRVSIGRALMNGGQVILADEPTGALDSQSGAQVMQILKDLHAQGHTIIIVTHDHNVASHAQRIVEIKDGEIISDVQKEGAKPLATLELKPEKQSSVFKRFADQFKESFKMAISAVMSNRLRAFLTMLGIIIGIASVVSVVALGQGSSQKIIASISSLGTNTIDIYPGKGFGDRSSGQIQTLTDKDAQLLSKQEFIDSVSANANASYNIGYKNQTAQALIKGVGSEFFRVKEMEMEIGQGFDEDAVKNRSQLIVIDKNTQKKLFTGNENPLGKIILVGNMPAKIIGVAKDKETTFGSTESLNIWLPYSTVLSRLTGRSYLNSITVRVSDNTDTKAAEAAVVEIINARHGTNDVYTVNMDSIKETVAQTTGTMTLLVSAIAVISLIVGGVGVMNIMLVSVTERTKEIGVRMAIGARQSDILQQFLIEAVLICLAGGIMGILLSLAIGLAFNNLSKDFAMIYSTSSIVIAFLCSTLIGIIFGFLPAKNAAKLDPVVALARD